MFLIKDFFFSNKKDLWLFNVILFCISTVAVNAQCDTIRNIIADSFKDEIKQLHIRQHIDYMEKASNNENLGECYHDVAFQWFINKKENLDSAIYYTKKAVVVKNQIHPNNTVSLKKSLYNLGYFHLLKEEYFDARNFYSQVIDLGIPDLKSLHARHDLGLILFAIGDYQKARSQYEYVVENFLEKGENDLWLLLSSHLTLLNLYVTIDIETLDKPTNLIIQKLDSIFNSENITDGFEIGQFFVGKANHYLNNNLNSAAAEHYKKILQLKTGFSNSDIAIVINNLGVTQFNLGDKKKSKDNFLLSVTLDSTYSDPFENLGDWYSNEKNFMKSLVYYQRAINLKNKRQNDLDIYNLPSIKELQIAIDKTDLLDHLTAKANAWLEYYKHDGNTAHLNHALTTFERADELIDIIRSQSTEYQSKLYWRGQSSKLYMKAVEVSFLLDRPHKAYYFMERNKALLLLEDITHEKAKELSQLPDSIAKREFELKRAILLAENTLQNNSGASPDSVQNFKNDIFQHKRSYEKFLDSLTTAFPDYARLKQQFQVLSYQDFKSNYSSEETATLQFILNDEQGYALLHANDEPHFYELENAESLNKNLLAFYANLSKFDKDLDSAKKVSNTIFKSLLPETAFESIKNKELIIVPDYNLQKIPFEALVTDTANKRYLLEDVELRYAYSLSYLEAKKQVQTQAEEDLLALAPVDFENLGLAKLGFSGLEVDALKSIFGGETWLNENASKENLLKNLHKHGILHFATHADIDENGNHWVAFSDDKLYLNEIYATRNQADMVVLSACNTSRGELKNGEGVMSLARAFFNSGAKSVVSSLWPTVDKTSKDIMVDFYSGLDEGLPKATALRNAKLTYLQNNPGASPAKWAALIVIGDNRPVRHPNFFDNNWHWMALAGGLLVVPVFLWRRRQNQAA